eukprot:4157979-Amphidinium_carterae.1
MHPELLSWNTSMSISDALYTMQKCSRLSEVELAASRKVKHVLRTAPPMRGPKQRGCENALLQSRSLPLLHLDLAPEDDSSRIVEALVLGALEFFHEMSIKKDVTYCLSYRWQQYISSGMAFPAHGICAEHSPHFSWTCSHDPTKPELEYAVALLQCMRLMFAPAKHPRGWFIFEPLLRI